VTESASNHRNMMRQMRMKFAWTCMIQSLLL